MVALILSACASPLREATPLVGISSQTLVLGASGEHLLIETHAPRARALAAAHPAHLVRQTPPAAGVLTLNNVSIPLSLVAPQPAAPASASATASEESYP